MAKRNDTVPEQRALEEEATRINAPAARPRKKPEVIEETTEPTGVPLLAKANKQLLDESRALNEGRLKRAMGPRLHPLVPIGTAFALLLVFLLLVNWLLKS
ncbi:MAG: hypothetical protein IPJ65_02345 [Archangiaceae bacterium]|nr:hypothetical protein [Archangiaceae bacterium]